MRQRRAVLLAGAGLWSAAVAPVQAQGPAGVPRVVLILTSNAEATRTLREHFVEGMHQAGQARRADLFVAGPPR